MPPPQVPARRETTEAQRASSLANRALSAVDRSTPLRANGLHEPATPPTHPASLAGRELAHHGREPTAKPIASSSADAVTMSEMATSGRCRSNFHPTQHGGALPLAIAALLVVACGDESTSPSNTTTTASSVGGSGSGGTAGAGGASTSSSGGAGGSAAVRRVFVTSDTHTGDLGGLTGGHAICEGLADAAALGGTWLAWLGDGVDGPSSYFTQATVPYVLVDGTEIASSWSDLVDGSLAAPIDRDETGTAIPASGPLEVKTGTFADGGGTPPINCMVWTVETQGTLSLTGRTDAVDQSWTQAAALDCSAPQRLYCFEQ
jgi:hypothetical protein